MDAICRRQYILFAVIALESYRKSEMPRELAIQIVSYVRMQWPALLAARSGLWESTPYPSDGMHFVLRDEDLLIGHALAHRKTITHAGESWTVGALSSVFVYPAHRGGGHGAHLAAAATDYLRQSGIDFALLFCGPRVRSLYARCGWEHFPRLRVHFGDAAAPRLFNETDPNAYIMALRVSQRLLNHWRDLESSPLYVGERTW